MTTETQTLTDRIVDCLRSFDYRTLIGLYTPDAVIDANVPFWRYQLLGPSNARRMIEEEMAAIEHPRVASLRETLTDDGVVVESEVHFREEGEDRLWRDVHIFHTDGERIVEHIMYCTGNWDAATIKRQADEAPMVRKRGS